MPQQPRRVEEAVLEVARRQLAEAGPSGLSLRAIAREIGVVPSALYRYYSGRDAILSALIKSGFDRLGETVETAVLAIPRHNLLERWRTAWATTRLWAVANPHEYALLYGTPVAGYEAAPETIVSARRVVMVLVGIMIEAQETAVPDFDQPWEEEWVLADFDAFATELDASGKKLLEPGRQEPLSTAERLILTGVDAWMTLFGTVSFELFGHYPKFVASPALYLMWLADDTARRVGIA